MESVALADFFVAWRIGLIITSAVAIVGVVRAVLVQRLPAAVRIFVVGTVAGLGAVIWTACLAISRGSVGSGSTALQSFFVLCILVSVYGFDANYEWRWFRRRAKNFSEDA